MYCSSVRRTKGAFKVVGLGGNQNSVYEADQLTRSDDQLVSPGPDPKQPQVILNKQIQVSSRSETWREILSVQLTPSSPTPLTSSPTASTILTALSAYLRATSLTDTPSSTASSPPPLTNGLAISWLEGGVGSEAASLLVGGGSGVGGGAKRGPDEARTMPVERERISTPRTSAGEGMGG